MMKKRKSFLRMVADDILRGEEQRAKRFHAYLKARGIDLDPNHSRKMLELVDEFKIDERSRV